MRQLALWLGRPVGALYQRAKIEGLTQPNPQTTPKQRRAIVKLARQGLCNPCIAKELGLGDRHTIARWRTRAGGAPSAGQTECTRCKERTRETTKRQLKEAGVETLAQVRTLAFRKYARENGWPEDLRPREVQILNVLADRGVPMTRLELAEAIGMRTDRIGRRAGGYVTLNLLPGNGPGGTYTASLMRRGFLLKVQRAVRGLVQGAGRDLYFLGPAALAILEERARLAATGGGA